MRTEDARAFRDAMAAAAVAFGEELSDARLEVYFQALRTEPIESLQAAIMACIRECRFFPRPAEILERARPPAPDLETQSHEALQVAMEHNFHDRHYRFEDDAIHEVIRLLGGWEAFCETVRTMPAHDWAFYSKEWRRLYVSITERGVKPEALAEIGPGEIVACPYLPAPEQRRIAR